MNNPFTDIMGLPRPQSKYPKMPSYMRAAQFAPFAALSGFENSIEHASRVVEQRPILSKEEAERLNQRLVDFLSIPEKVIRFHVFVKDKERNGGTIVTRIGKIKHWEEVNGLLKLETGERIQIKNIVEVEEYDLAE